MPARKVLRRIDAQSGHALEILGHAIEYLADEYAHAGGSLRSSDGEVQAIQLLMALNREIYLACPEVPTFADRCSALAHHLGFRHHRNCAAKRRRALRSSNRARVSTHSVGAGAFALDSSPSFSPLPTSSSA
jgi:hypothetical protein